MHFQLMMFSTNHGFTGRQPHCRSRKICIVFSPLLLSPDPCTPSIQIAFTALHTLRSLPSAPLFQHPLYLKHSQLPCSSSSSSLQAAFPISSTCGPPELLYCSHQSISPVHGGSNSSHRIRDPLRLCHPRTLACRMSMAAGPW